MAKLKKPHALTISVMEKTLGINIQNAYSIRSWAIAFDKPSDLDLASIRRYCNHYWIGLVEPNGASQVAIRLNNNAEKVGIKRYG